MGPRFRLGPLVGLTAYMDALEKRWIFCFCQESKHDSSVLQPVTESLQWLSYPDSYLGEVKREKFRNTNLVEGGKEKHKIRVTQDCNIARRFTTGNINTSRPHTDFLTTYFCKILYVLVLFMPLTFRHLASCILGQAFQYSPENAFYIFNQQIYFIIWYLLHRASLI